MKILKKAAVLLLLFSLLLATGIANADEIMPRADAVFSSAYPNLMSTKSVLFRCTVYQDKESISVTSCWVEQNMYGAWERYCMLPVPSLVMHNAMSYVSSQDYSNEITDSGKFRVWATFNADGYTITRCSNERTFP